MDGLGLAAWERERLERLGLKTREHLAALPRGALVWILGETGRRIEEIVRGEGVKVKIPEEVIEGVEGVVDLDPPCGERAVLVERVKEVLRTLWKQLVREGKAPLQLDMLIRDEEGEEILVPVSWRRPVGSVDAVESLLRSHWEKVKLSAPVVRVGLYLGSVVVLRHHEMLLWGMEKKLEEVEQQMAARGVPLMRVVWDAPESRLPERRAHLISKGQVGRPMCVPKPVGVQHGRVEMKCGWVPIEEVMETWQVDWEWWSEQPVSRRYYWVRLENGAEVRLFQEANSWFKQ